MLETQGFPRCIIDTRMEQRHTTTCRRRRAGQLVLLVGGAVLLALSTVFAVGAQETPGIPEEILPKTPEPTEEVVSDTVVRIEIDAPADPVPEGEEFEAQVLVENVEHLAGFDFTIEYDPERVTYERLDDLAAFLESGERETLCGDPINRDNTVIGFCTTINAPVCLGGPPGPNGSGLLGRVVFKSKGGGDTTLKLTKTTLALDDLQPCDPESPVQAIAHRREDASVNLVGGGGFPWLIVGPILGVAALLVGGGLAGFMWYRRRAATSS